MSRATISHDLAAVKSELKEYHLDIVTKANYGMKILGSECHLRAALTDYLNSDEDIGSVMHEGDLQMYNPDPLWIKRHCTQKMTEYGIFISDQSLQKFVNLIIVSDYRIKHKCAIDLPCDEVRDVEQSAEFHLAQDILKALHMNWSQMEIRYMTIFIISRRTILDSDSYDIRSERKYFSLSGGIIDWIYYKTGTDFTVFPALRLELARHLRGMAYRLQYGLEKRDLGVLENKRKNAALEYAVLACDFITGKIKAEIQENSGKRNHISLLSLLLLFQSNCLSAKTECAAGAFFWKRYRHYAEKRACL